jgi:hypothetical protein
MATATRIGRMSPRPRKELDTKSKRFDTRFAIHLRKLLDKRRLTTNELHERVQAVGLDVSFQTVTKWLSGERLPRAEDAESIAAALGIKDYRHVWPDPA